MDELVVAGQAHGVPIAAVLEPSAVMHADHFQAVGAMADAELVPGVRTSVPVGYFLVDGQRAGFRTPAPAVGIDEPRWHGPGTRTDPGPAEGLGGVPDLRAFPFPACASSTSASSSPAAN